MTRDVMWTCAVCVRMGSVLVQEGDSYWSVEDRIVAMHKDVSPECGADRGRFRLYDENVRLTTIPAIATAGAR